MSRRISGFERSSPLVNLDRVIKKAHEAFVELISISEDKKTGLTTVSVEHKSPDIAKQWVELVVSRVSEDLRSKTFERRRNRSNSSRLSERKPA